MQETRRSGHLRVAGLRICYRTTQEEILLESEEQLQPWTSQMAIFSCLSKQKVSFFSKGCNRVLFARKWLFGVKNLGSFLLQLTRKDGHLQVPRLQFFRTDQPRLRLRRVVIDSQPSDLQMNIFSCPLHHKVAELPQTERPLCQQNMKFSHF